MSKKIIPTSYRIPISNNWWTIWKVEPQDSRYYISHERFIRKLIDNILLTNFYFTSELFISFLPQYTHVQLYYYSYKQNNPYSIYYLLYFIKRLYFKLFNKKLYFTIIQLSNYTNNSKILSSIIKLELSTSFKTTILKNYKFVLKQILKQFIKSNKLS